MAKPIERIGILVLLSFEQKPSRKTDNFLVAPLRGYRLAPFVRELLGRIRHLLVPFRLTRVAGRPALIHVSRPQRLIVIVEILDMD